MIEFCFAAITKFKLGRRFFFGDEEKISLRLTLDKNTAAALASQRWPSPPEKRLPFDAHAYAAWAGNVDFPADKSPFDVFDVIEFWLAKEKDAGHD